ncbi:MAG: transcription termination factor NusA [Limisphaerales bacterium]|nr:transcription termination/antitermination protein NusA [Pedosphaera sp.]MEC7902945.1 transcription termination factor NusA [Verrucomicrobiota bacterium]HCB97026.1 transcription termination/antitermination protein NusA [Verrucomicrobiales bacterium]HCQ84100.1 transcription termination/antitermination protein NusA [Verrucomicrobiales bacterium]
MNADLLTILEYWEREKGISRDILLNAVEEALISAAKKAVGPARDLRVQIDPKSGDIRAYATLLIVEHVESKHDHISLQEAKRRKPDAQIGEEVEVEVTPENFGRIASQNAKQALLQHLRKAEKQLIYSEFKDRTGDIVSGIVRRFERSDVYLDLGKFEALLPNRERVPTEEYQLGERVRCFVKAVDTSSYGPEIILSRADPDFVIKLFRLEVSEINDGTIEIKAIAREPGYRTKLAVYSTDSKVDPVGACVGLRGQRVKNIVRELNNEKVDIIPWDPDISEFVANALNPAQLRAINIDEERRRLNVVVDEDQLSLAIGKRGQNARLTSKLCGWHVDIQAREEKVLGFEEKVAEAIHAFAAIEGISEDQAGALVNSGFHTLEDLSSVEIEDLAEIPGIGDAASDIMQAVHSETQRRLGPAENDSQESVDAQEQEP